MSAAEYVWLGLFCFGGGLLLGWVWRRVRREVRYYEGLIKANVQVLANNRRVLNTSELLLFQWKEHGLWMHDVARDVLTAVGHLEPANPGDLEALHRVQAALTEQLQLIDGSFYRTFHLTPEEYRERRRRANLVYVSDRTGKQVNFGNNTESAN